MLADRDFCLFLEETEDTIICFQDFLTVSMRAVSQITKLRVLTWQVWVWNTCNWHYKYQQLPHLYNSHWSGQIHLPTECPICMQDLFLYDPCDWVRLFPDWFEFWSRFSAWPTTRKGNGVELELPNVFCLTLYYLAKAVLLHWKKSCENAMTGNTKDEPYQNVCVNRSWHDYD